MSFIQLTINIDSHNAETLSDAFMDLGALSAGIEDQYEGTDLEEPIFNEPGMDVTKLWDHSKLVVLLSQDSDLDKLISEVKMASKLDFQYHREIIDDQDWVRLTQSQFNPIKITNQLYIVPSWHELPDKNSISIVLDPGLAFGTGSHPTTHLCLEWLIKEINVSDRVLDYGCGSGILSIAAKKCGAKEVVGVDIDPQAIISSMHNAKENHVDVHFYNSESRLNFEADIVVANILSSALSVLAPILAKACKPHGKIALSGILKAQVEMLTEIYSAWFNLNKPVEREGWILMSGTKKSIS